MHIKFSKINFYLRFPKSLDVYWPNLSENAQSVQGVPFQTPPGTLSAPKRARCPIPDPTWYAFAGNLVQLSQFLHLLDMFCGESCPAVPISAPAGHVLRGILSRCPIPDRTCWTCFAENLVQVSRFPHLLDMFCGESCPGVPISAPAGTGPSGRSLRKFGCWLNIADEGCLVDLLLQYQVEVCCKEWGGMWMQRGIYRFKISVGMMRAFSGNGMMWGVFCYCLILSDINN